MGSGIVRCIILLGIIAVLPFSGIGKVNAEELPVQAFVRDSAWNKTYSRGMTLYNRKCGGCHGKNGEGGHEEDEIGLPLNLQSFLTVASKNYIMNTIKYGRD